MELIDTHCHIHDTEFYPDNREEAYHQSREAGVVMLCVGTDVRSSREAIEFCTAHPGTFPIIGIHPHESKDNDSIEIRKLVETHRDMVVGIGEIGLDYFYDHSPHDVQQRVLREQLAIAQEFDLPVSFHVRDTADTAEAGLVWRDFWPIIDEFPSIRGVLHSFTDTQANLEEGIRRGFKIGVNGISTFTKDEVQQRMYHNLPLEHIVLETDAPFLTPKPFRGKMNIPAYVGRVAQHQAELKGVTVEEVCRTTSQNARSVFGTKL
jgi:TatD DNase family protein